MPVINAIKEHKILLDTHVLLWLVAGDSKFKPSFRKILQKEKNRAFIYLSTISFWEIGMLTQKGRVELDMECLDWATLVSEDPNIEIVELSTRIAIQSTRLPDSVQGDPADRMLIATARELNAVLVTHDKKILEFGKSHFISAYDPIE